MYRQRINYANWKKLLWEEEKHENLLFFAEATCKKVHVKLNVKFTLEFFENSVNNGGAKH